MERAELSNSSNSLTSGAVYGANGGGGGAGGYVFETVVDAPAYFALSMSINGYETKLMGSVTVTLNKDSALSGYPSGGPVTQTQVPVPGNSLGTTPYIGSRGGGAGGTYGKRGTANDDTPRNGGIGDNGNGSNSVLGVLTGDHRDGGYGAAGGGGNPITSSLNGGDISSNAMLLSVYYNLDGLIGKFKLRPYVGAGIGMANNKISDYDVFDARINIIPGLEGTLQDVGTLIYIGNTTARHNGGTTSDLAYALEAGITYNLTDKFLLDFFGRWVNLGRVESKGIFTRHENFTSTSATIPVGSYDNMGTSAGYSGQNFPDWKESGTLSVLDVGLRLRLQF